MDLDSRKQTILQAIVIEYVTGAEPIGSELIAQKYGLGVKSATVRNEMADLSDMGYLEQPHTSAGRIPSDLGYRYYVDRLIVTHDPDEQVRGHVKSATSEGDALHGMLRDTLRALSRATQLLGVATTVRDAELAIKTAVVSALGPTQALVVLVLGNGHVENRMIECPAGLTLQDIGRVNELLQVSIVAKQLRTLIRAKPPTAGNPAVDQLLSTIWSHFRSIARDLTRGTVITEGEEFMFGQPEFQRDAGTLAELLKELTETDLLYEAIAPTEMSDNVTIGRENRMDKMRQLSVVRHRYFVGDSEAGVIALVGPTRMRYDRSIPLISFTARALSDSLTRFFG
jgi:heat-inducible transcriptional repressor